MEKWEAILERPIDPGQRAFEKIIQTATVVLKNQDTDLAPFETEWIINTLLGKPVNLLQVISENRGDELWTKPLSDAFKLLADIVAECACVETYYEDIVNLCQLSYDAELRKHALNCLTKVVQRSEIGARDAPRHIAALEDASQCKTPLALLVGAICEHHPSVVCNDINRIWRTYLNMLEIPKNTDKVTKALLQGICSVFKNFGEQLPTSELNNFYDSLSFVHINKSSCVSACFEILQSYAFLFRERISMDKSIRDVLWNYIGDGSESAVLNVYNVIQKHVEKKVLEKIIATEVLPHTLSNHTRTKLTALRILASTKLDSFGDLTQYADIQTLENEFRRDKVTHGNAEMVSWCIEANLPNSERLLQAAILFYDKLPATVRKKVVVNGILESPDIVRQAAIHFLITQSCDDVERFIQIWRDLYDVTNADDLITKSHTVTTEFCTYVVTVLENFLDERKEFEELPPKLTSLLQLTSRVVPLISTPLTSCASLLCELAESYTTCELIAALRAVLLTAHVDEMGEFYKSLHIEGCRDEATLHETCLSLIQAPISIGIEDNNMILALKIIFSSDVEPEILCDALKKLDYILTNNKLDPKDIYEVLRFVEKLRTKGDKTDRRIRILHREVLMFLGKHGNTDINNNANSSENSIVVNLKKTLSLNLPHNGSVYKLNLQRILLLALHHEDPKTLQVLMTMLYANQGCRDEATLHETCLSLIQAPISIGIEDNNMILALKIIFSSDVEPEILCDALKKLDYILTNNKLDPKDIYEVLRFVEKLRTKGDKTDRRIRILHREVLMFLGKHGNTDINNNANSSENSIVVNLKKTLSLNLPHNGSVYKLNLQRILLLALHHEDPKTLQVLMTMLYANLSSSKEQSSQLALTRLIQTLAKVHTNGAEQYTEPIQRAIEMCDDQECIRDMLQFIGTTKSCGVRKLLSTALSTLCEDINNLQLIVERADVMLSSSDSTTKKAGLDLTETIIANLENNNSLSKIILPRLITSIAKTYENEAKTIFDLAAKMFIDKKELFDKTTLRETAKSLMKNLINADVKDVKIYKATVKVTIDLIRNLPDVKVEELFDMVFAESCQNFDVKVLYVLAVVKNVFDFDNDVTRKVLGRNNYVLLNSMFNYDIKLDGFELEAILKFLQEYCLIILELKYVETIKFLSDIIANLKPNTIRKLRKNINECLTTFQKYWNNTPVLIKTSFQTWTEKLPLKKITHDLDRHYFPRKHIDCVNALQIMSNIFGTQELTLSDVKCDIAKWPKILLKLYASGSYEYYYNEKSYFNEILTVSLTFLTLDDVKKLLKEGSSLNIEVKNVGVIFGCYFIDGFSRILTEKPFVLLDHDMKHCCVILNDLVKYFVKKSYKDCENLLELVDKLFPTYREFATFAQILSLLSNLECLPKRLSPESNVYCYVLETVCSRQNKMEERIKMASFIPDEALSSPRIISAVSELFPARLCELRPELLEAIANKPSALFVEMLAALVANDTSSGWWDEALDSCLSSLASRNSLDLSLAVYARCERSSVCTRVLAPLLRYSTPDLCEKFLSKVLKNILSFTRPKIVKANLNYQKCIDEYMVNLSLLLVAFEKLPTSSIEASSSPLYSDIPSPQPWHIVRETLKLCHTLRDSKNVCCPDDATEELKNTYRQFQCLLYNCYCAAICRRRPSEKIYAQVFGAAWEKIVDEDRVYELPITPAWVKRTKSVPVSVPQESTSLLSSHSHIFLRTLSEDPMLFDLHTQQEAVSEIQDISLPETDLNTHPCAGTLTAMFRHVASLPFSLWTQVAAALEGGRNLRWLIAQIICNCKEELKPHASVLVPGLLAVVAETVPVSGNKCLNGLHLDVLDTILYWKEDTTSPHLNTISHHLITTCMEYRRRNVFDGLVRTLALFLEVYGSNIQIQWRSFEAYYEVATQDIYKAILQLIRTICRNKIYIPQVLGKILSKLDNDDSTFVKDLSKVAEAFGLAMAVCQDVNEKEESLSKFKKYLSKCNVTNYVKLLHYSCMEYPECCGELEFRKITDYVTKVSSYDRTKCLHIISVFLSNSRHNAYITDMFDTIGLSEMIVNDHVALLLVKNGLHVMSNDLKRRVVLQICDMCQHSTVKVRKAALDVMLKAFEDLFPPPTFQPPSKRQKTEFTPILGIDKDDLYSNSVLTALGRGLTDCSEVARAVREGVSAKLDKDLGIRFAECFFITIYLPAISNSVLDLSVCVSAILEMLYSHMRSMDTFKNIKLREEPLVLRETPSNSKLLSLSKAFQGTFSSYSTSKVRRKNKTQDVNKTSIDVQVPIDDILGTLLEFAEITPQVARALLTEVLRSLLAGSGFDLGACLLPWLGSILDSGGDVTPLCVDVCRVLVGTGGNVGCLLDSVDRLRNLAANTEGACLTSLLYEEVKIRHYGDEIFQLGELVNLQDVSMDDTTTFSLEDLKFTYGKLSNWDNLTIQQRKRIQKDALPPLWANKNEFLMNLNSYEVPSSPNNWFDKMAACFKQQAGPKAMAWLRDVDKWPRRHFEISAITEATSWRHMPSDLSDVRKNVFTTDECLAEWAARLMIRTSYYDSLQHSEVGHTSNKLSRSQELSWCQRANEMAIPRAVLDCVKRNVEDLCENETMAWLLQKLIANRIVALERNDCLLLKDVLEKAKLYTPRSNDPNVTIEMYHLMLQLHNDMKSLSYHDLQTILLDMRNSEQKCDWKKSPNTAVSSVFEAAMGFYDDSWETGTLDHDSVLSNMSHVFCQASDLNATRIDMMLLVMLNRLEEYDGKMNTEACQKLLERLSPLTPKLDQFSLNQLKTVSTKFPAHLLKNYSVMVPRENSIDKYKRCLQVVCDANHLLVHYCGELLKAVRNQDANLWKTTFDRMKAKIYENPYTGPSYKLLDKYKEDLYQMYHFETTPTFLSKAETKLTSIGVALKKEPQSTLRLSDLCPTLLAHREGDNVARLFGLKDVRVVKFYDKVQVFTDSIRRPVILSVLLSNGMTLRTIHKTGERLAGDAGAQCTSEHARRLCGHGVGGYHVTLLDEDSALIEFLEGHQRLRALIESSYNINVLPSVVRPADHNLIETSMTSALRTHRELCAKVPAYALRSAIEQNSTSVEDFISKKRNFTESLAHMSIIIWILGLGDRHLQNIMWSQDGVARCVDWGDIWRHGATEAPARLTRNLLAVCDLQVLESRLQTTLAALRNHHKLFEAVIKVSFKWMGDEFNDKIKYIQSILHGTTLSHHITKEVTMQSDDKHKDKHLELMACVFRDFVDKEVYSVEEQISCLLRHCTSTELLSVIRAGWEPWV